MGVRKAEYAKPVAQERLGHLHPHRSHSADPRYPSATAAADPVPSKGSRSPTDRHSRALPGGNRMRRWWPIVMPLAVLAAGASLLSPAGRHQWALSLFRQPTRYTALFFNKSWALPATGVRGEPITISFTIGNQEGHLVRYKYIVSETGGRSHRTLRTLKTSARTVANNRELSISAVIRPTCATSRCLIQIALPGHPETVDFLMTLDPRKKENK